MQNVFISFLTAVNIYKSMCLHAFDVVFILLFMACGVVCLNKMHIMVKICCI